MAWYQYYLTADGTPISLSTLNITPEAGQSVVEVSATDEPPTGEWNQSSLSFEPISPSTILKAQEFKIRFTDTEWNNFVAFARGASPAAELLEGLKIYILAGAYINLASDLVVNAVNEMEEAPTGPILSPGRAAEILDITNQPSL